MCFGVGTGGVHVSFSQCLCVCQYASSHMELESSFLIMRGGKGHMEKSQINFLDTLGGLNLGTFIFYE